jgi:polyhydroxybutyrate depolymerase
MRRFLLLLLAVAVAVVLGASAARADPASYVLHVPGGPDHPRALVLVLPSSGATGAGTQATMGLDSIADREDFTTAYLDPQDGRWDGGMCCLVPGTTGHRDDVATIRATVTDIAGRTDVDTDRVYAVGVSGGGFMAWRMACEAPDIIAAAATQVATLGIDRCAPPGGPQSPVWVLNLLGEHDRTIPMEGGPGFESDLGRADFPSAWVARLRCLPTGQVDQEVGDYAHSGQPWFAERAWSFLAALRRGVPPAPHRATRWTP